MHFITVYQLKIHPAELKCKRLSRLKWNFETVSAVWTLQQHPDHHSFSGPDTFIVFNKGKKLYQNRAKITKIIRIKTTVKSHLFSVFLFRWYFCFTDEQEMAIKWTLSIFRKPCFISKLALAPFQLIAQSKHANYPM